MISTLKDGKSPRQNRLFRWGVQILGFGLTLACLVYIARQVKITDLKTALVDFSWPYLVLGVMALAFGYTMRILRWGGMLRAAGAQVSSARCASPFLASIALNNVLPFRVGDVVRAFVFPNALGVSKTSATGSLVMERLVDLLALLVVLGLGLIAGGRNELPGWLREGALALAFLVTTALLLLFLWSGVLSRRVNSYIVQPGRSAVVIRIGMIVSELLGSFSGMSRPRALVALFAYSGLVWLGELGLFLAILRGFDLPATLSVAAVVMAIATLSTLVPSSPGYVGPFHLAAYFAVGLLGGTAAQAVSCALIMHLALWLPTTLAGGLAILLSPGLFSAIRSNQQGV